MSAPLLVRPRRLTHICRLMAVAIVAVFAVIAVALGSDSSQVFELADQIAMVVFGLLFAAVLLGLTRARVLADVTGVRVRNVIGERGVPWQVVREVRLDDGQAWARLDLQDDDTVALFAVQANDGERAVRAVLELRALLAASRGDAQPERP